ncbi:MAG: single-stranded DNA-binding protein, partial [Chitinispirillaceae bacterium]|nr:single-stranded DNA-binding protein [Chitinispirillaceae bacterium]
TRSWDDKDGNKRYKTEIVANQIQFLGSSGQPPAEMESGPEHGMPDFDARPAAPEHPPAGEDDLPF